MNGFLELVFLGIALYNALKLGALGGILYEQADGNKELYKSYLNENSNTLLQPLLLAIASAIIVLII